MATQADRITSLIISYLNNELDEPGRLELEQWMNKSEDNRRAVEDFLSDDQLKRGIRNLYTLKERIWKRLDEQIPDEVTSVSGRVRRAIFPWRYAAAAAILVLLAGTGYWLYYRAGPDRPAKAPVAALTHDVAPGGNKAVLIMAGGGAIALDSAGSGTLARLGHTNVVKISNGALAYHSSGGDSPSGENILQTPRGGQYQLTLPDGTRVWLNAASSIRFPTAFRENTRKVTVTGEVYFEVARDVSSPFIVNVDDRENVEVLGTRFNVNAYADEASLNTTLLDGSVRIAARVLKPAQQYRLYESGKTRVVDDANLAAVVAWKNGQFQFDSEDIAGVMRQIARWYNVDVVYQGGMPQGTYSGEVSRNTNLSNVLKILELSGLQFKIAGNKVTVLP